LTESASGEDLRGAEVVTVGVSNQRRKRSGKRSRRRAISPKTRGGGRRGRGKRGGDAIVDEQRHSERRDEVAGEDWELPGSIPLAGR
jgi:hypothetical protein